MRTPLFSLLLKGGTIVMGYGGSCGGCGFAGGFVLLVVLFILLIIIGCTASAKTVGKDAFGCLFFM